MKKNAPKILAVILLSAIAVLMIVAGSGSLKEVFSRDKNITDNKQSDLNIPSVDASGDKNNPQDNEIPNVPDSPVTEPEINYFPIKADRSGSHRFTQNLALVSATLNASHSTAEGTFYIVTHTTTDGAFKVTKRTQTLMKMNEEGDIVSALSLNPAAETEYLASKLTADGLVLAVNDNSRTYLYTVSLDFVHTELLELPSFSNAGIFSLSEGFLLMGKSTENTVYKIKSNVVVSSSTLQAGDIKAVYDFSTHYALFLSGINRYSFIKLDRSLKLISTVTLPNRTLLAVEPIVENGAQKFIAVELLSSGVEIAKYSLSFSIDNSDRVGVGLADRAEVFMNGESVFLLLHAHTDRLYLVDKNLSFTASNNTTFQGITELYDCYSTSSGYKVLYAKGETLTYLELRNDGTAQSLNLDTVTDSAFISMSRDEKYSVIYKTEGGVAVIGII